MEEQLISFETAKLAKEKGFNMKTIYAYHEIDDIVKKQGELRNSYHLYEYGDTYPLNWNKESDTFAGDSVSAPTQSLLQNWIWETRKIHVELHPIAEDVKHGIYWQIRVWDLRKGKELHSFKGKGHGSSTPFKEIGLLEALKLI